MDIKEIQKVLIEDYIVINKICEENNLLLYVTGGTCLGAVRHNGFIPWDDDIDLAMPRKDYNKFTEVSQNYLPSYMKLKMNKISKCYRIADTRFPVKVDDFVSDLQLEQDEEAFLYIDLQAIDGASNNKLCCYIHSVRVIFHRVCYKLCNPSKIHMEPWRKKVVNLAICLFHKLPVLFNDEDKLYSRYISSMVRYDYYKSKYCANYYGKYGLKDVYPREWWGKGITHAFENTYVRIPVNYDKYLRSIYGDYMNLPPERERVTHIEK